jgi:hypothetical protein
MVHRTRCLNPLRSLAVYGIQKRQEKPIKVNTLGTIKDIEYTTFDPGPRLV